MVGPVETAENRADLGHVEPFDVTHLVLISLGVFIAILTVVSALGILPPLRESQSGTEQT